MYVYAKYKSARLTLFDFSVYSESGFLFCFFFLEAFHLLAALLFKIFFVVLLCRILICTEHAITFPFKALMYVRIPAAVRRWSGGRMAGW